MFLRVENSNVVAPRDTYGRKGCLGSRILALRLSLLLEWYPARTSLAFLPSLLHLHCTFLQILLFK